MAIHHDFNRGVQLGVTWGSCGNHLETIMHHVERIKHQTMRHAHMKLSYVACFEGLLRLGTTYEGVEGAQVPHYLSCFKHIFFTTSR